MRWRLSLEGACVLAAYTDRMENVCVMQRTASDKRSVFLYSALQHTKNMHTYVYICVNISQNTTEGGRDYTNLHVVSYGSFLQVPS